MTSEAFGIKGERLSFSLDGGSTWKDVRVEGEITIGNAEPASETPQTVFADAHRQEKPVKFGQPQEDALSFETLIRQGATAGDEPFCVTAFRAGGYAVATPEADDTIASYTDTGTYTTTTEQTTAAGKFRTIELVSGEFFPVLMAADGAAGAITPLYKLPSATEAGKAIKKTWTITPNQPGEVDPDDLIEFAYANRANPDERNILIVPSWLASVGDLELVPGQLPKLSFTFGASSVAEAASEVDLATANVFSDADPVKVLDQAYFILSTYSAAGKIDLATQCMTKATIAFGVSAQAIPGIGCATAVNGVQGAVSVYEPASLEIEILWDEDKIVDWEGANASKTVGIVQSSKSANVPAMAFIMPNAHLMERIETSKGEGVIVMTLKYTPNPAGMDSQTATGHQCNKPFYFGISDRSA